jgi:GT2 family glycosyltransferase
MHRFFRILGLAITDFPTFWQRLRARFSSPRALPANAAAAASSAAVYQQWIIAHDRAGYSARVALDLGPLAIPARQLTTRSVTDRRPSDGDTHIILLSNHTVLHDMAVFEFAALIQRCPSIALVYGDYDHVTGMGERINPVFLPDWDPDLFWSTGYLRGAILVRADLWDQRCGMAEDTTFESLIFGLVTAVGDTPEQIAHIPHILSHLPDREWIEPRPRLDAHFQAVRTYLQTSLPGADARQIEPHGIVDVRRPSAPAPAAIAVIIPTRDGLEVLMPCVQAVRQSVSKHPLEIIIIDNASENQATLDYLAELKADDPRVTIIRDDAPFNFAGLNNRAAAATTAPLLCFLNNDTEVISADWLDRLAAEALRPEIGAVGARLLYPDGRVQHTGVILGLGGVAGHGDAGRPADDPGPLYRAVASHRPSALTAACLMMRSSIFNRLNGFDATNLAIDFNDVDLCLRLHAAGYATLLLPTVELVHKESISRGDNRDPAESARFAKEVAYMRDTWGADLDHDPAYNPNLSIALGEAYSLAESLRTEPVWKRASRS